MAIFIAASTTKVDIVTENTREILNKILMILFTIIPPFVMLTKILYISTISYFCNSYNTFEEIVGM